MEATNFAGMSSRGRQSPEMIQANCILIKRFLTAEGYSVELLEGQIAKHLGPYLEGKGPPAKRTVQKWVEDTPNFPEMALKFKVLKVENILPQIRPYLQMGGPQAELEQDIPSMPQAEFVMNVGSAVAVGLLVAYAISRALKRRPGRQGLRFTGRKPI